MLICRKGQEFEARYLRKGFEGKITVYRILDSRAEKFKLSKAYENKVEVINVITAPEIEMLVICKEGKYKAYENAHRKNPKLKPSSYCKGTLGYKNIKDYDFVKTYFSDVQTLIDVLFEYRRITKIHKDEKTLSDLLR